MSYKRMTLSNLAELDDGRVVAAFEHELRRAVADCKDRPGDKTPREVTLQFRIKPIVGDSGCPDEAEGEFHIKSKVPTRKSRPYSFVANAKGDLVYSSNSPTNVNQRTFDDINPETGEVELGQPEELAE